jgi:hypothetical protein
MDAKQEAMMRSKLAEQVQHALHRHQVTSETLSETVSFLASVLGGMIGAVCPPKQHDEQIKALRGDIEYGIEHGVPEE